MHESGLMQEVLHVVTRAAALNGGGRVLSVRLRVGALSPYGDDAIRAHFEHMAEGTAAQGAVLHIEHDEDPLSPIAQSVVVDSIEVEERVPAGAAGADE